MRRSSSKYCSKSALFRTALIEVAVSSPVFEMIPRRMPSFFKRLSTSATNGKTSNDSKCGGGGEKTGVPKMSPMSQKTTLEAFVTSTLFLCTLFPDDCPLLIELY